MRWIITLCIITLIIIFYLNLNAYTIAPLYDFCYIIQSPFSFQKENLSKIGILTGITTSLLIFDNNIQEYIQENKNKSFSDFLLYPEKMGEGEYILGISGIFIISGEIAGKHDLTRLGIYVMESFLISGIIVTATKFFTGRARPYMNKGAFYFKPFNFSTGYKSFYSGHTTIAFAFASTIANFAKNIYIGSFLYLCATFTGIARIYHNKHWASDVFVGAITGILIGKSIIELNEIEVKKDENSNEIKITIWKGNL